MCDPVTALAGTAMLMQGISGYQAGRAEGDMLDQQARLTGKAARDVEKQGLRDEETMRDQVRQFIGGQRAALGASGVVASEGSAATLQDEAARQGEIDALTVRNNAYLEAWGMKTQARSLSAQAKMARRQAGMTLLTSSLSAGSIAAKGYMAKPPGGSGDMPGPASEYERIKAGR